MDGTGQRETTGAAAALTLLEMLPLPAWVTDREGRLIGVNDSWRRLTGLSHEAGFGAVVPADDAERLTDTLRHVKAGGHASLDLHVRAADGEFRAFDCAVRTLPAELGGGHVGVCYDLTESRMQERRLSYMATHDKLTGLPNRWLFEEELKRAVSRAGRGSQGVVMMMDLDGFKAYNDARGHPSGDQALVNIALLLQTVLRASDVLARFGGDEFAVLLEDASVDEACDVARRMRDAAAGEFVDGAREAGLGLSVGITRIDPARGHEGVLEDADAALYRAKQRGRGKVVLA